ncbi:tetratricopeptide repeat protein [Haloferula rosea]|uniref:Tetratricopeptide repeat protein n=1 Tax=Haloferula rosea TaxID=490093 RepID=A0A934RCI7_9BACT|nr:tetratricopeptide repeat protein [Haloferula rosea]MBK1826779.1 tetratricopeptide repeat protein [Haloferula rosea]
MNEQVAKQVLAVQGYVELGLLSDAEEELNSIDPNLDVAGMLRCDLYSRQSKWPEMRELAERLARQSPQNSQWWISWAYAVRRIESVDAAREILVEARESHPDEPIIVYNLACYASVSENYDEARELLDQAIALDAVCKEMAAKDDDLKPLFQE